jgi:hypothetical protein
MAGFVLHLAIKVLEHSLGHEDSEEHMLGLAFRAQIWNYLRRIRVPSMTARTPQTPVRIPSAPSRPGLPIVLGVGAGAMVHRVGTAAWSYRRWIAAGVGAYLLGSNVRNYLRRRSDREQDIANAYGNL